MSGYMKGCFSYLLSEIFQARILPSQSSHICSQFAQREIHTSSKMPKQHLPPCWFCLEGMHHEGSWKKMENAAFADSWSTCLASFPGLAWQPSREGNSLQEMYQKGSFSWHTWLRLASGSISQAIFTCMNIYSWQTPPWAFVTDHGSWRESDQ